MSPDDSFPTSPQGIAILAVVVVYERVLDEVEAWPELSEMLGHGRGETGPQLEHLLIYDNSALPRAEPAASVAQCTYVHNPSNGGTAAAYAHATRLAIDLGLPWLLLLDHDTQLPTNFLAAAASAFQAAAKQPTIAALVPMVRHRNGALVSPVLVTRFGTLRPLELGQTRRPNEHLSAIASGTILRVKSLRDLLPLPEELWLDYVDHWIFAQLHRRGLRSIVLSQVLQHDLSIVSLVHLSPTRLDSVLRGEARFHRLLGPIARLVYPWRVAWRVLRLASVNPKFAFKAFRSILHRHPRCP